MALRRGLTLLRTSAKRKTAWGVGPVTTAGGQAITASAKILGAQGSVAQTDGLTLVRTRGELVLALSAATATFDGFTGAFGIGLVSAQAFAIGLTAIPGPLAEEDWDGWLVHRYFHLVAFGPIVAANVSLEPGQVHATTAALRFEIDSKAMRKFQENMVLVAMLETVVAGTAVGRWYFDCRMLFKLP